MPIYYNVSCPDCYLLATLLKHKPAETLDNNSNNVYQITDPISNDFNYSGY